MTTSMFPGHSQPSKSTVGNRHIVPTLSSSLLPLQCSHSLWNSITLWNLIILNKTICHPHTSYSNPCPPIQPGGHKSEPHSGLHCVSSCNLPPCVLSFTYVLLSWLLNILLLPCILGSLSFHVPGPFWTWATKLRKTSCENHSSSST